MANAIDYATAKISPPYNNIIIQDKKIKIKVVNKYNVWEQLL